jgi:glycopeptide antibiotics resistance protein
MRFVNSRQALFLLIGYALLLSYWMIFGFGRTTLPEYSYNLVPFSTIRHFLLGEHIALRERLINLMGNIIVFVPFGILLPFRFHGKFKKSLLLFLTGLFMLEALQLLFKRGSFDIDDFILNTAGFLFGYLVFKILKNRA